MICLLGGSTEGGRGQKKWELNKSWEQKGTAEKEIGPGRSSAREERRVEEEGSKTQGLCQR